jgi:mannose-6-phosphate isomerase
MSESIGGRAAEPPHAYPLLNEIRHYAWGGPDYIPRLLGLDNPDSLPCAELWMGDHPSAPSTALMPDGRQLGLDRLISGDPGRFLSGPGRTRLPYLLKVLSAVTPLSLQAHPSLAQAAAGFERESASGLSPRSPERFYKDKNHKPEIFVALEHFSAMCGFRDPGGIGAGFAALEARADEGSALASLASGARARLSGPSGGLSVFYRWLGGLPPETARAAALEAGPMASALEAAGSPESPAWEAMRILAAAYPGDPGVFSALYLNQVRLEPRQGFFVPAGVLHAYLRGTGIELMASSDNVLRGGLSPKKVDLEALIEVLIFDPYKPVLLKPESAPGTGGWQGYERLCPDFSLHLTEGDAMRMGAEEEILICVEGDFSLVFPGSPKISLKKGNSVFVPAHSGEYGLAGKGLLFKASPGNSP